MMADGLLKYLLVADAALIQCSIGLMLGALASIMWLRRSSSAWGQSVTVGVRRWLMVGAGVALAANILMLWLQSAVMSDGVFADAWSMVPMMVNETHFGQAWLVSICALFVAVVASAARWLWTVVFGVLATAVFAATRSVVSHAGSQGDVNLQVAVDWLHLMLTSLWIGMVLMGCLVALRRRAILVDDRIDSMNWISSLSETATWTLFGILLTGIVKIWWASPSWAQLSSSTYGGILLVKVALVGCAAALGGFNKFWVMPHFTSIQSVDVSSAEYRQRFTRILWVEAAVLLSVAVVAALLSGTSTPGEG